MSQYKIAELKIVIIDRRLERSESKTIFMDNFQTQLQKSSILVYNELLRRREGIEIVVDVQEGSVKARVTIFGLIMSSISLISNYGDFRGGLDQIIDDSSKIVRLISDNVSRNNPYQKQLDEYLVYTNYGVLGELRDIIDEMDDLEKRAFDIPPSEYQQRTVVLKQRLSDLLSILDSHEKNELDKLIPNKFKRDLPQPDPFKKEKLINKYGLTETERKKLIKTK